MLAVVIMDGAMRKTYFAAILVALLNVQGSVFGALLDGTTSIKVQDAQYTFDATTTGATGIVWLRAGFTIDSGMSSDVTFNISEPVLGATNGAGKTIKLEADLTFGSLATLSGDLTVKGEGYALRFNGDLSYGGGLVIASDTVIDAQNNRITLNSGSVTVNNGCNLVLRNGNFVLGSSLTMGGSSSILTLDNCTVTLLDNYTVSTGQLVIRNTCTLIGAPTKTLTITSTNAGALTINSASSFVLYKGVQITANTASGTFVFTDYSSRFVLVGATLHGAHATTFVLKGGQVWADHTSVISGTITIGHATETLSLEIMPGTKIAVDSGTITYANPS